MSTEMIEQLYGDAHKPYALEEAKDDARRWAGISPEWVLGYLNTDTPENVREAIKNSFKEYSSLIEASNVPKKPLLLAISDMAEHYERQAKVVDRTTNEYAWIGQFVSELKLIIRQYDNT